MFDTAPALHTDLYTLTMAASFWKRGRNDLVTFELFVRSLPKGHGFLLAAGLAEALSYLENLRFTPEQLDYLASLPAARETRKITIGRYADEPQLLDNAAGAPDPQLIGARLDITDPRLGIDGHTVVGYDPRTAKYIARSGLDGIAHDHLADSEIQLSVSEVRRRLYPAEGKKFTTAADAAARLFDPAFLDYLAGLRFTGEVVAVPEGTVITAQVPILRITAPRIEASIVESALLSIINFSTRIATTAARAVIAAAGRPVLDMALRRLDGPEGATTVARSAYLAGFTGTAVPAAAMQLGIPVFGTMAHHYVMSYGEAHEQQAFEDFLNDYPHGTTLLVDTYDTLRGVRRAIAASLATGVTLTAIRIDSGDLTELSFQARAILDEAGFTDTKIVVSNDLTPELIDELVSAGAPIDTFGIGTQLKASAGAALGGVMKITMQHGEHAERFIMKKAPGKQTDPGAHQVFRTDEGQLTLGMANELLDGRMLLRPVMKAGVRYGAEPTLDQIREHAARELAALPPATRAITDPQPLTLNRSAKLLALRASLGDTTVTATPAPIAEPALA